MFSETSVGKLEYSSIHFCDEKLPDPKLHDALQSGLDQMQIDVTEDQCRSLAAYVELLVKWNKVINLTAVRDPLEMVSRHILDSLSVHEFIDSDSLTDVGAGAGLPGIPLAILKPHMNVTLIDSVAKKTRFIQQSATELRLGNVTALHSRVEEVSQQANLVIARAFAAPDKLAALTRHLLPQGGRLLAMVGQMPKQNYLANISGFSLIKTAKLTIPDETAERNIVILQRDQSSSA